MICDTDNDDESDDDSEDEEVVWAFYPKRD